MEKHYEAIAKIIGGTLHSSNRLRGLVKTFVEYFNSVDDNFDEERFSKDALNGSYVDDYIEEPIQKPKVNTWAPKPITVVDGKMEKMHEEWQNAMNRMSNIVGKSYGRSKIKRRKRDGQTR